MKVILLKDVPRVGRKHEVKEVSPGFARTMLLSRSLAVPATPAALEEMKRRRAAEAGHMAVEHELAEKAAEVLEGTTITLRGRAGGKAGEGHLFAALHAEDVAAAIKREKNINLSPSAIILDKPLKEVGFHKAKARLGERAVNFTILLEGEVK